jgi:hypothetical protein
MFLQFQERYSKNTRYRNHQCLPRRHHQHQDCQGDRHEEAKIVAELLVVADECIEASVAQARLVDAENKGFSKKKQQEDHEVNTTDRGNRK